MIHRLFPPADALGNLPAATLPEHHVSSFKRQALLTQTHLIRYNLNDDTFRYETEYTL
jgi:hypothetical protein